MHQEGERKTLKEHKEHKEQKWKAIRTRTLVTRTIATPLWGKCEDETRTPKSGNLESFEIPETSELNFRGQNTLPWGVLYTLGKVLKCRCRKWPRMSHSDICNISYDRKRAGTTKSRESTWPRCVQIECDTSLESSWGDWGELQIFFRPRLNHRSKLGVMSSQNPGSLNRDSFGTPPWES